MVSKEHYVLCVWDHLAVLQLCRSVLVSSTMVKAAKRAVDTATVSPEAGWYCSETDWPGIRSFCRTWVGDRNIDMVSVFDRSKRMSSTWRDAGHSSTEYDIAHDPVQMDICTRVGFYYLLGLLLKLARGGFSMWAPPCSLWIFLTSSLHKRSASCPDGNTDHFSVRLANRIAINAAMALKAVLKFRSDCAVMIEQPSGSWLFKYGPWKDIIQHLWLRKSLTYQGLFGGPLPKPTHLVHSLKDDKLFARKLTKNLKKKKFNRSNKVFYIKDANGSVTGTKMLTQTSIYPKRLATAIYKSWVLTRPG